MTTIQIFETFHKVVVFHIFTKEGETISYASHGPGALVQKAGIAEFICIAL